MRWLSSPLALLVLTGCSWTVTGQEKNQTIHLWDAPGDLAKSLAVDDRRFVGMMGEGLYLPGVSPEEQPSLVEKYGVKVLDAITDVEDGKTIMIRGAARDYAQKYNVALLRVLDMH